MGNIRKTKQKKTIEEEIKKIKSFFSAEELYDKLKNKDSNIGIATIYRYLKDAVENGKLYTYICDRKSVYSNNNKSHCHFECEKTGKITHIEIDNLDFLKGKIPGSITSFQLEVKGICKECENNN